MCLQEIISKILFLFLSGVLKVIDNWAGSGSGFVSQIYGSADADPYQNVTDPDHCYSISSTARPSKLSECWLDSKYTYTVYLACFTNKEAWWGTYRCAFSGESCCHHWRISSQSPSKYRKTNTQFKWSEGFLQNNHFWWDIEKWLERQISNVNLQQSWVRRTWGAADEAVSNSIQKMKSCPKYLLKISLVKAIKLKWRQNVLTYYTLCNA